MNTHSLGSLNLTLALLLMSIGLIGIALLLPPNLIPALDSQIADAEQSSKRAIQMSTSRAEEGELVIFTAQLTNTASYPVTITGAPQLDIVLEPQAGGNLCPIPVWSWAEDERSMGMLTPTLEPGEVRTYQWRWVASDSPHI